MNYLNQNKEKIFQKGRHQFSSSCPGCGILMNLGQDERGKLCPGCDPDKIELRERVEVCHE
jgi:hypothetical protein